MNKNTSIGNFTRGGQMMTHQIRMFGQGLRASLVSGALSSFIWSTKRLFQCVTLYDLYHGMVATWVFLKLEWVYFFCGPPALIKIPVTFYHTGRHHWVTVRALSYLHWPEVRQCDARINAWIDWMMSVHFMRELLIAFGVGVMLSVMIFVQKGWRQYQKTFERGGHLVSPSRLTRLLTQHHQNSDITLDGLPLVKHSETIHMMFSGTTGSGKTNALHKLLPQIRKKGQKALIVDLNGAFVSHYYRGGYDILLNPLDQRTCHWSPWADCQMPSHYDAFAEAMIPSGVSGPDTFWEHAARTVLASALEEFKNTRKCTDLCQLLLGSDIKTLAEFFHKTPARYVIGESTDRMSLSVLATLSHYIKGLLYVQDTPDPFSIREWLHKQDDSWLFLTAAPDQRATLRPLLTTWLDIAFNGLMSLDHTISQNIERRVWFILDELPALQKVPSLQTALAESRKFGGCVVAGIQNIHQLQKIYGLSESQALLNLFNTSFIFRTEDPETCRYLSSKLGEQQILDVNENISYGANTIRDGVSLNVHQKRHPLVLPTELSLLPNLTCYVKYPGTWPVARHLMTLEQLHPIAPAFEPHERKARMNYENDSLEDDSHLF